MITFDKAQKIVSVWVTEITDGACEICQVIDKPYGWVFFYTSKNYDPNDLSTFVGGNSPVIFDRVDGELKVTGTAYSIEQYLKEYEESIPEPRLFMKPLASGFINKYE
jgi:hypothetical protein